MKLSGRAMREAEILIRDKEEGITSFSSLSPIKREYKGMKVGHAGTLDKFASGLMIVLIGKATKLNPVFSSMGKSYLAEITFGKETDTLDPEGMVIREGNPPSRKVLEDVIPTFLGKQKQIPPVYSAIHVDGKRAYIEARSGNDLTMPERDITIDSIDLLSFDGEKAVIRTSVSKGTYIRSLARDIGIRTGSAAYVSKLRRLSIGPFTLDDIPLDTISLLDKTELFSTIIVPPRFSKSVENGYFDNTFIASDSHPERPFAYIYLSTELFGFAERKEGRIHIMGRF